MLNTLIKVHGIRWKQKCIFLTKKRNDAIIAQSVSFRFHFARYGTLRIAQGSFLYYKSTTYRYTLFTFSPDFFLLFFAPFCKLTGKNVNIFLLSKKAVFRNKICPNKDPDPGKPNHCGSGKLYKNFRQNLHFFNSFAK